MSLLMPPDTFVVIKRPKKRATEWVKDFYMQASENGSLQFLNYILVNNIFLYLGSKPGRSKIKPSEVIDVLLL